MTRRTYDSTTRQTAALETRRRIIRTAHRLLTGPEGYAGMSVAALASAAGVSPQTIYNAIGGKAEVLKACYDTTLAGDDEPVPMSERPAFLAIWDTTDPEIFLDRYAAWARTISDRVGPLVGAITGAGGAGDRDLAAFVETIEEQRRIGTTMAIEHFDKTFGLPAGLSRSHAVDLTWTLNSPEVYDRLVRRCGWSPDAYQRWLAGQLRASLLP